MELCYGQDVILYTQSSVTDCISYLAVLTAIKIAIVTSLLLVVGTLQPYIDYIKNIGCFIHQTHFPFDMC